jgi:hypothetical protein
MYIKSRERAQHKVLYSGLYYISPPEVKSSATLPNRTGGLTVRPERVVRSIGLGAIGVCLKPELATAFGVTCDVIGDATMGAVIAFADNDGVDGVVVDGGGSRVSGRGSFVAISCRRLRRTDGRSSLGRDDVRPRRRMGSDDNASRQLVLLLNSHDVAWLERRQVVRSTIEEALLLSLSFDNLISYVDGVLFRREPFNDDW